MVSLAQQLTGIGRRVLNRWGYDVYRLPPTASGGPARDMWSWLKATQTFRTLIDIGANDGAFAAFLARQFLPDTTYVFEPLPRCRADLEARAATIPNLKIIPVALSDQSGRKPLYENSYHPASSLLRVSPVSKVEFPQTVDETPTIVEVARLDDVLEAQPLEPDIFIKIDVQGMEDAVIRGGQRVFGRAKCVLVEMSFVPMYEGQPLFEEVHRLLEGLGFRFAGIKNQIDSPKTGQPLFAHCFYLRSDGAAGNRAP